MAIQMRRGANTDFNASKMLPGEVAVTTDGTKKAYVAFAPNVVKELASKEDVQDLINSFTSVVDKEIAEAEQRIESKGQEVLDTIPDLYEEVSARADEAVRTKADAIICTVSGVTPIAQDSSDDYIRNLKVYGKTTQPTTSGKQLCNFPDAENINYEGITWSCKNGVVTAKGTSTALSYTSNTAIVSYLTGQKGTYFISGNVENVKAIVGVRDASGTVTYYTNQSFTLDGTEQLVYIYCQIASGVTVDATLYPMLNEGTTALHWEKYTGNAPSPSPYYPQPLESKGKWGNLLDISALSPNNTQWTLQDDESYLLTVEGGITVLGTVTLPKGTYTMAVHYENSSIIPCIIFRNPSTNANYQSNYGSGTNYFTHTFTEETEVQLILQATQNTGKATLGCKAWVTITEGTNPLPSYRPYSGQMEIESALYGGNFCDNVWEHGYIDGTNGANASADVYIRTKNHIPIPYNQNIYMKRSLFTGYPMIRGYDESFNYVGHGETFLKIIDGHTATNPMTEGASACIIKNINPKVKYMRIIDTTNDLAMQYIVSHVDTDNYTYTKQSHISLVTETGLKGIPVTDASLATYTDEDGQMWCADYVDCERGVLVQRILEKVFDGSENILIQTTGYNDETPYFTYVYTTLLNGVDSNALTGYKCNKLIEQTPNHLWMGRMGFAIDKNDNNIRFRPNIDEVTDVTTFKAKLKEWYDNGEPLIISGIRRTPIETPLTASEIESFKALRSNYHVTTVMNDCDAYMDFTYNADTEIWINNKIEAKVASALASLALS